MKKFLGSKRNIVIIVFLILAILFSIVAFDLTRKQNIHNATETQLNEVQGIGDKLSKQIYEYVQRYNVDSVEELKGHINYLSDKRINNLEKKYK